MPGKEKESYSEQKKIDFEGSFRAILGRLAIKAKKKGLKRGKRVIS